MSSPILVYLRMLHQVENILSIAILTLWAHPTLHISPHRSSFNLYTNMDYLAQSAAHQGIEDGIKRPVCFSVQNPYANSRFCDKLYTNFKAMGLASLPSYEDMVHTLNISSQSNVDREVGTVLDSLRLQNHSTDSIFAFSEYVFDSMNMVSSNRSIREWGASTNVSYRGGDVARTSKLYTRSHQSIQWVRPI